MMAASHTGGRDWFSLLGDLHAHGPDAAEFYTRMKTVTSRFFSTGQGSSGYFVER
jgi:malonate-semialdehyde dehydrogenase (acetylating) / methylmalonate-semialdehyde dehydrogenase